MFLKRVSSAFAILFGLADPASFAQSPTPPARPIPARTLGTPTAVSPQMQAIASQPPRPDWNKPPSTAEGWRAFVEARAKPARENLPALLQSLGVEMHRTEMGGVPVFVLTPRQIRPENRNRLLIHIHGGCYVMGPGEAGLSEAVFMAGFGGYRVISVDYRMPPTAYFPAALDDAVAVWRAALRDHDPKKMAIFGSSAGGALTLAVTLRAKAEGLPLPAAIAPGTPMADVTGVGDSFQTNAFVDNSLVAPGGFCDAATRFYANGHDLGDPLLSPVYGDVRGFPPAILTSGTRDLLLSNTVRMHRRLRQAGVEATLQVFEGQAHAQYYRDATAPESREAFSEIATFFDHHLGA
jgi:monoterpene epsilon-lactone hydrolase